jgi:hypothetical protein
METLRHGRFPLSWMATPVDPLLTAIERDHIAYDRSTRPRDVSQHGRRVKSHKPMRTLRASCLVDAVAHALRLV